MFILSGMNSKIKIQLFLFIISTGVLFFAFHPLHLGLLAIEIKPDEQKVEGVLKVFSDDLYNSVLYEGFQDTTAESLNLYLKNNLKISLDKESLVISILKISSEELQTVIYFESLMNKGEQLTIENRLILNLFDDQKNLVTIKQKSKEKGYILKLNKTQLVYKL